MRDERSISARGGRPLVYRQSDIGGSISINNGDGDSETTLQDIMERTQRVLTNKSGAHRRAGDVVILSPDHDDSFTTTATEAIATAAIGVLQEDIQMNEAGLVAFHGYVPAVNLGGASPTRGHYLYTSAVAGQGTTSEELLPGVFGVVTTNDADSAAVLQIVDPPNPQLCAALVAGTETVTRFYFTNSAGIVSTPTPDAAWDHIASPHYYLLSSSPSTTRDGGTSETSPGDVMVDSFSVELDEDWAERIATGGATLRAQARSRARSGIGISEAAQDVYSMIGVRVTQGDSTTIRGTALALTAGTEQWQAQSTYVNKSFGGTLSAVGGAVAGDFLLVEMGYHNLTDPGEATGGGIWFNDAVASDLPENETETANDNSWLELRSVGSVSGSGLNSDLVGTSLQAARCDHKHHVTANRAPGVTDDTDLGYPVGTFWVYLDSTDDPTEVLATYLLVDATAGAAVWLQIGAAEPSEHTHPATDVTSGVVDHGTIGATETFDATDGTDHEGTLDENLTVTLTGATAGEAAWMTLVLTQDGTGGNSITLPASVVNASEVEGGFDTDASAVNVLTLFSFDGGTTWYGFLAGSGATGTSSAGRYEVVMTPGVTTPPEPVWTTEGDDWVYGLVEP